MNLSLFIRFAVQLLIQSRFSTFGDQLDMSSPTKSLKIITVALFLTAGTISTFAYKLQGSQYVDEGSHHKKFFHPYMQSFSMFVGESFCILLYFSNRKKNVLALEEGKTPHKFYIFFIPALSDALSSMLQYMGLSFIAGSTYMMFKGATIVTTAIFSKMLFNMVIQKRHLAGCGLAVLGITIVGSSGFFQTDASGESNFSKQLVGYILMIISLVFNGFLYAYEQLLLKRHTINPMEMVGYQGLFGLFITSYVAMMLSIVPCTFGDKNCSFDSYDNPYIQRIDVFFQDVGANWVLAVLFIVGIATISIYNLNGVRITKMFDALTRSLLNVTKTSVVWIVGIIITLCADGNPDYQLQSLNIVVNIIKAVGFGVIIFGTLIYNKLIFEEYFASKPMMQAHAENQIENHTESLLSRDEGAK